MGAGGGGIGGARRTEGGGSDADRRTMLLGGGGNGVGLVGRGTDDGGEEDAGADGEDDCGFDGDPGGLEVTGAETGGDSGFDVDGRLVDGLIVDGLIVDGLIVDGLIVDGLIVGGLIVDGDDLEFIDGCVVGDELDVAGPTSILLKAADKRPGKTVGGCASCVASMTIGGMGRFTEAIIEPASVRRTGDSVETPEITPRVSIEMGTCRGMFGLTDLSSAYEIGSLSGTTSRTLIASRTLPCCSAARCKGGVVSTGGEPPALGAFAVVAGGSVSGTEKTPLELACVIDRDKPGIRCGPVVKSIAPVCAISGPVPGASSSASMGSSSSER
jgi:hypothetical protein